MLRLPTALHLCARALSLREALLGQSCSIGAVLGTSLGSPKQVDETGARCSLVSIRALGSSGRGPSGRSEATAAVYAKTGPPNEVLLVKRLFVDPCEEGELEIKFLLAPINPADINTIEGRYPLQPCLPGVPGHEGVGVVSAVGPGVTAFSPGDWVVPLEPAQGTWRTHGVFKETAFHKIPNDMHLEAAAALCINPPTALVMLEDFVKLKPGDVIAQNGANSAVGQMVIQLARSMGVKSINIIRERDNWDETVARLKAQGADVVTTEARAKEDAKAQGLKGAVLGLNCVGGAASLAVAKLLREGGTHVTYGGMSLQPVTIPTALLIYKDLILKGFWLSGRWAPNVGKQGKAAMLDRLVELIKRGDLKIEATESTIFPLEKVHEALAVSQRDQKGSKVYLKP